MKGNNLNDSNEEINTNNVDEIIGEDTADINIDNSVSISGDVDTGLDENVEEDNSGADKSTVATENYAENKFKYKDLDDDGEVERARQKILQRETKKKQKRQIKLALGSAFGVALIFAILSVTVLFNVKTFEVNGSTMYVDEDVIDTASIRVGENLFRLNRGYITAKLRLAFPYIEDVTVRRSLPNKLVFDIKEAKEKSAIRTDDTYAILSESYRVLKIKQKEVPKGVTLIEGLDSKNIIEGNYIQMQNADEEEILRVLGENILKYNMVDIRLINIEDVNDIKIEISDNRIILLGDKKGLQHKFIMYDTINKKSLKDTEKVIVNCKNPERVVVSPIK